jgi:translation initiation factor eIF-2B subunit alpha/methylthioribose-1-phosphate isomerase
MVITGADRIVKNGDFANKIGTYEKAVLAKENGIPFYIAAPISTFDKTIESGDEIIIEERGREELAVINNCKVMPDYTKVRNPAFDVTPAKYVAGYITEKKILKKLE